MPLAKAPQPKLVARDRKAEALIARAGSNGSAKESALTVRVPPEVRARIDARVKARRVRTPLNTLLLEAIYDWLDKEEG